MTAPELEPTLPAVQARTVRDFCRAYGVGKTTAFELISEGRLAAVKAGKRTLIIEDSAREWLKSLVPTKASAKSRKLPHKRGADFGEPGRTDTGR